MDLRGYDSYEISLGDEMRGERASLGKSLADAERDMRIKGRIIEAIEDCDLSGFPNQSVIAGYVRSYARYLGLDPENCFQRFCAASGYVSPSAIRHGNAQASVSGPGPASPGASAHDALSDPISRSRFAAPLRSTSFRPRVSIGALSSSCALVALIGGLGYGGYALLQDIQRVGFAPLPEAPSVVADAPVITSPDVDMVSVERPQADAYAGGGVLTAVVMPTSLSDVDQPTRDGPISAINPADAGLFEAPAAAPVIDPAGESHAAAAGDMVFGEADTVVASAEIAVQPIATGVVLVASEDAWVRVRDGGGTVLYEGILSAGERFDVPDRLGEPVLRAGNAGGVFVVVDGVAYGPVGERGRVVSGVSLRAADVRQQMPEAQIEIVAPTDAMTTEQRADAAQLDPGQ